MASIVRQNYHEDSEAGVNRQINLELYASYTYMSMAYHFDRDDVALAGFHKYFIETEFLTEQGEAIKELAGFVTNLKRVGAGLGEYMFDKEHFDS